MKPEIKVIGKVLDYSINEKGNIQAFVTGWSFDYSNGANEMYSIEELREISNQK